MKIKIIKYLLVGEAIVCVIMAIFSRNNSYLFLNLFKFPFEQVSSLLRVMSLSGFIGNMAAIFIYVILCSLPIMVYMLRKRKNILIIEDIMLIVLSIALFIGLYLMINQTYISNMFVYTGEMNIGFFAIGGTIYSIAIGYIVLRTLHYAVKSESVNLIKGLKVLLFLISTIDKVAAGNSEVTTSLHMTNVFLVIKYIFMSIPVVLELLIIYHCNRLLTDLSIDRFSEQSIKQSLYIVKITKKSISIIVFSYIILNVSQLLFSKWLLSMNYETNYTNKSSAFYICHTVNNKVFI